MSESEILDILLDFTKIFTYSKHSFTLCEFYNNGKDSDILKNYFTSRNIN